MKAAPLSMFTNLVRVNEGLPSVNNAYFFKPPVIRLRDWERCQRLEFFQKKITRFLPRSTYPVPLCSWHLPFPGERTEIYA